MGPERGVTTERTVANVAVEWFFDVLLVFCSAHEYYAASVAFCTFGNAGNASTFYWMVVFYSYGDCILGT